MPFTKECVILIRHWRVPVPYRSFLPWFLQVKEEGLLSVQTARDKSGHWP